MNLLFKRAQSSGRFGRVQFKLWAIAELDQNEQELVTRYKFDEAILLDSQQPTLLRNSLIIAALAALVVYLATSFFVPIDIAILTTVLAGAATGWWWFNEKRETIYVRDLIHGRYFTCSSIIDLAHKEARLQEVAGVLRQVMESAKHWDGVETVAIPPLPPQEAKLLMLRAT